MGVEEAQGRRYVGRAQRADPSETTRLGDERGGEEKWWQALVAADEASLIMVALPGEPFPDGVPCVMRRRRGGGGG